MSKKNFLYGDSFDHDIAEDVPQNEVRPANTQDGFDAIKDGYCVKCMKRSSCIYRIFDKNIICPNYIHE